MSDGTKYSDQRLLSVDGGSDEDEPRGLSTRTLPVALLALLLIVGVGVLAYFAGHALWQEAIRSKPESLIDARQAPVSLPQPAPTPSSDLMVPPPVVRMLEAQSRSAAVVAKQRAEEQSAMPAASDGRVPHAPAFRPPPRVLVARRAMVRPPRVLYASRTVQLGEFPNRRQAAAAYARLIKAYPYLKTLPKTVKPWRSPGGSARTYHLRLRAFSPDHARILCRNLLAIGRGCAVMPERA